MTNGLVPGWDYAGGVLSSLSLFLLHNRLGFSWHSVPWSSVRIGDSAVFSHLL